MSSLSLLGKRTGEAGDEYLLVHADASLEEALWTPRVDLPDDLVARFEATISTAHHPETEDTCEVAALVGSHALRFHPDTSVEERRTAIMELLSNASAAEGSIDPEAVQELQRQLNELRIESSEKENAKQRARRPSLPLFGALFRIGDKFRRTSVAEPPPAKVTVESPPTEPTHPEAEIKSVPTGDSSSSLCLPARWVAGAKNDLHLVVRHRDPAWSGALEFEGALIPVLGLTALAPVLDAAIPRGVPASDFLGQTRTRCLRISSIFHPPPLPPCLDPMIVLLAADARARPAFMALHRSLHDAVGSVGVINPLSKPLLVVPCHADSCRLLLVPVERRVRFL